MRNLPSIRLATCTSAIAVALSTRARAEPVHIRIDPRHALHAVSPYLTGACLEDVNHEIYGGLYSQMIFGESFQEPSVRTIDGWTQNGGEWTVGSPEPSAVNAAASDGAKLISNGAKLTPGSAFFVEIRLPTDPSDGNAGVVISVNDAGDGADQFKGYEISLDAGRKILRLARHRNNYELIRDVPCEIKPDQWVVLSVARRGERTIDVSLDGKVALTYDDPQILPDGAVGLRTWHRPAQFRFAAVHDQAGNVKQLDLTHVAGDDVSRLWRKFTRGDASGAVIRSNGRDPFVGTYWQRIDHENGIGPVGIENQGLNRQGMGLIAGKPYVGHIRARTWDAGHARVALASADGTRVYATSDFEVNRHEWTRFDFTLKPDATDLAGRFEVASLGGTVEVAYAFLSPGEWGTVGSLPVRKDVAETMLSGGVTAIRYGGSMVNEPTYRWKQMIGDRDHRQPYRGHWYDFSSNGWGIVDFLNFAEASKVLAVPDVCIDESPQDMLDFVEYVNGPATSEWGAKRVADGHPEPYHLTHIELGNEERVDEAYWKKFEAIARALWSKDPAVVLVVGDFTYRDPISDPFHITGADSHITTLAAHQKILALAKQFGAEVWFDVHVWTDAPHPVGQRQAWQSYVDAIDGLAGGAKHHVAIFELNANTHGQLRALANAQALLEIERDGRLPFVSSANALQVDGQNDNQWDQGLCFMNPVKAWLQPPAYVWQMASQSGSTTLVDCAVPADASSLDAVAMLGVDGKSVELQAINLGDLPLQTDVEIANFTAAHVNAQTLAGELNAANTADAVDRVRPTTLPSDGRSVTLPPRSFTVIRYSR